APGLSGRASGGRLRARHAGRAAELRARHRRGAGARPRDVNFFESQDAARRRTLALVLLFGAAVVGTVGGVQGVVALILLASREGPRHAHAPEATAVFVATGLAVLAVVVGGSLYK